MAISPSIPNVSNLRARLVGYVKKTFQDRLNTTHSDIDPKDLSESVLQRLAVDDEISFDQAVFPYEYSEMVSLCFPRSAQRVLSSENMDNLMTGKANLADFYPKPEFPSIHYRAITKNPGVRVKWSEVPPTMLERIVGGESAKEVLPPELLRTPNETTGYDIANGFSMDPDAGKKSKGYGGSRKSESPKLSQSSRGTRRGYDVNGI